MEEGKIGRLEGAMEQINQRLNHGETEISEMRSMMQEEFLEIRREMRTAFQEIRMENRSNFKWLLGVILCTVIPMWVSVILTILFKS